MYEWEWVGDESNLGKFRILQRSNGDWRFRPASVGKVLVNGSEWNE